MDNSNFNPGVTAQSNRFKSFDFNASEMAYTPSKPMHPARTGQPSIMHQRAPLTQAFPKIQGNADNQKNQHARASSVLGKSNGYNEVMSKTTSVFPKYDLRKNETDQNSTQVTPRKATNKHSLVPIGMLSPKSQAKSAIGSARRHQS